MNRIQKRWIRVICFLFLSYSVLLSGIHVWAEEPNQDVVLTIHEYDWTAYSSDYKNAQQTTGYGEHDAAWDSGKEKYALERIEFTLIKVADMGEFSYDGASSLVEVKYKINDEVKQVILPGSDREFFTADELKDAIEAHLQDVENYSIRDDIEKYGVYTTDENGIVKVTVPSSDEGVFLVVESKVTQNVSETVAPFLVTLPMVKADGRGWNYDVNVYLKNNTTVPTVRKLVRDEFDITFEDSTSVTPGNWLYYNLVGMIPEVNSDATKFGKYEFLDYIPKGIECETVLDKNGKRVLKNPRSVKVRIYKSKNAAEQVEEDDYLDFEYGIDFACFYDFDETGSSSIRISLTEEGLKKLNANADGLHYISASYVTVVGDMDLLAAGETGNRSDVTLYYGRSSTTSDESTTIIHQSIEDAAVVFLYGFEIQKKFDVAITDNEFIKNVQFTVQSKDTGKYLVGEEREEGTYGTYKVVKSVETVDEATKFIPSVDDGVLIIDGIQDGDYEIVEVKTVDGYALLKEPIQIHIISKAIKTEATTANHVGQEQQVSNVGIFDVSGKEKAQATVNGEPAEVTEQGRIPRVQLTIINKKQNVANIIGNVIDDINNTANQIASSLNAQTGDDTNLLPYFLLLVGSIIIIVVVAVKKRRNK